MLDELGYPELAPYGRPRARGVNPVNPVIAVNAVRLVYAARRTRAPPRWLWSPHSTRRSRRGDKGGSDALPGEQMGAQIQTTAART